MSNQTATVATTTHKPPSGQKSWLRGVWHFLYQHRRGAGSLVFVLVALEIVARYIIDNQLFLASPTRVYQAGVALGRSGELWTHIYTSGIEFILGFAIASVVGIAIGALMGLSTTVRAYLEPWVSALYATPIIAIGPLFILWFGLGITSKVLLVVVTAIFPVIINTHVGLTNVDQSLHESVRSFGASKWQLFRMVRLPSSLPFLVAGERLAVARALVGVVVAELFGARAGLGYLILVSAQTFNTANLFVGVIVLAGSGVIAMAVLQRLEYRLSPWRVRE
ncbi:MAG: ABC transporter permease subunit [Actinobacteria bacterium]|nr:ABC transporter permease subunit [Actinomycetota bacterium]